MPKVIKRRIIRSSPRSLNAYNLANYDDNMRYLIGWPGYRTSGNKSGLDIIQTRAEWAHMQGMMIRWMITGKFRTHSPFYLLGIFLLGIFHGIIPIVFILHEVIIGNNWSTLLLLITSPNIAIGILLILNAILNLIYWKQGKSITGE